MIHTSAALTAFLRTKIPVKRNIKQAGLMTKDVGQQVTYGAPYTLLPSVHPSTSARPTKKTVKKIQEQNQLRMDIKKYNPGAFAFSYLFWRSLLIEGILAIQSINFALMQGFLPHFAQDQYVGSISLSTFKAHQSNSQKHLKRK